MSLARFVLVSADETVNRFLYYVGICDKDERRWALEQTMSSTSYTDYNAEQHSDGKQLFTILTDLTRTLQFVITV